MTEDRSDRIRAARAALEAKRAAEATAATIPAEASSTPAPSVERHPQPPTDSPARRGGQRPRPGRASKLALAGGTIGLGFGLVGAMATAAQQAEASPPAPIQRIVVANPMPVQPAQIIVMLPQNLDTPVTTIEIPTTRAAIAVPDQAAAPVPVVRAEAPVTESSGS